MSLPGATLLTPRRATLLTYAFLGLFALLSVGRLVGSGTPPWGVIVGSAVLAVLAAGPVAWLARDRIPAARRETLGRIALIVSLPAFALAVGVFAVASDASLLSVTDAVVAGVVCGGAVSLLAERTVVPERYRAERA